MSRTQETLILRMRKKCHRADMNSPRPAPPAQRLCRMLPIVRPGAQTPGPTYLPQTEKATQSCNSGKSLCCFLVSSAGQLPRSLLPPTLFLPSLCFLPLITGFPLAWCPFSPSHLYLLKFLFLSFKAATSSRKFSPVLPCQSYPGLLGTPISPGLKLCSTRGTCLRASVVSWEMSRDPEGNSPAQVNAGPVHSLPQV